MMIIEANTKKSQYFTDLWRYRELVYFLSWRDILVRYKQTVIGILWAVLRPLLVMLALSFVFGKLAKLGTETPYPYPLLVLSALIPWQFFASTIGDSSESLIANSNLVTKIYFPRMIIPISSTIVSLFDLLISLSILGVVMLYFQYPPNIELLAIPLFILLSALFSFGIGLWVSAFNVKYRDFRYVIPFCLQFGLYITPVGFSSDLIPEKWKLLFSLNPLVGIIEGFRWSILGSDYHLNMDSLLISIGMTVFFFLSGIYYFRKMEKHFADII